jgi:hypothetical protein
MVFMTIFGKINRIGKGNIPINTSLARRIENGQIVIDLPMDVYMGQRVPLFTIISPQKCSICGSNLHVHGHYTRHIISSYGIIERPVTYWICSNEFCKRFYPDTIVGVIGSGNYSDEFLQKQKYVRYDGKCSLWNSRSVGEIYTIGSTDVNGRAPCPTTLWKYEQKEGERSLDELRELEIQFDGVLYIDGYWVKDGWRKFIEEQLGRELTEREWKKLRYKIIYVVATKDKVVLDFQITNYMPSYLELLPLIIRIKDRLSEENIKKVVSDEDTAIIDAVRFVLPNAVHSFCVFHQLKNITKRYLDQYKMIENIPEKEMMIYELSKTLVVSETVIESTCILRKIQEISSGIILSEALKKVLTYVEEIYHKNRKLLEKGFVPETNNVMEQLFSLIDDIVYQARSFKTVSGMRNFFANLFCIFNRRAFNTGPWRGYSPIERAHLSPG